MLLRLKTGNYVAPREVVGLAIVPGEFLCPGGHLYGQDSWPSSCRLACFELTHRLTAAHTPH